MVKGRKGKSSPGGSFSYSDATSSLTFSSNKISNLVINGNHASFSGTAKAGTKHGKTINFTVNVTDNGDPGTRDLFSISLSTGYSAGANPTSGNIQVH